MAEVRTHGGTFKTDSPGYYRVRGDNRGCSIKLLFTPGSLVECPKIGLVQTATSNKGGAAYNVGSTARKAEQAGRSLSADQEGEQGIAGRHIDRASEKVNPMYGARNPTSGSSDLGSSAQSGNTHWGKRVSQSGGAADVDDAWLTDGPALNAAGQTSTQQFETTALCLEGDMAGTYLGSVEWGYEKDTSDVISLVPLGLVSMGVPTASWMQAAKAWNESQTDVGGTDTDNMKLPTTGHENERVSYSPQGRARRIMTLRVQLEDQTLDETTRRNIDFEVRALVAEQRESETRQAGTGAH